MSDGGEWLAPEDARRIIARHDLSRAISADRVDPLPLPRLAPPPEPPCTCDEDDKRRETITDGLGRTVRTFVLCDGCCR